MAELGDYSLIEEQDTVRLRFHNRYKENTLIFNKEDKPELERLLADHNLE